MFHGGLWGGWSFMVDNVTHSKPDAPSMSGSASQLSPLSTPPSTADLQVILSNLLWYCILTHRSPVQIWLDASAIAGVEDGEPLARWPDASGKKNDAIQVATDKQPTFVAHGWAVGQPSVRFYGRNLLRGNAQLPQTTTMFAVVRDRYF